MMNDRDCMNCYFTEFDKLIFSNVLENLKLYGYFVGKSLLIEHY